MVVFHPPSLSGSKTERLALVAALIASMISHLSSLRPDNA
jgi:hypothetical protein